MSICITKIVTGMISGCMYSPPRDMYIYVYSTSKSPGYERGDNSQNGTNLNPKAYDSILSDSICIATVMIAM